MSLYRRHHTLREIYYQARLFDEQELGSVLINQYLGLPADRGDKYHSKQAGGHKALAVMEK